MILINIGLIIISLLGLSIVALFILDAMVVITKRGRDDIPSVS